MGINPASIGVTVDLSRSRIRSDYASVQEQSGIHAGDGGFDGEVQAFEAAKQGDEETALKWAEGGEYRVAGHVALGASGGDLAGATGGLGIRHTRIKVCRLTLPRSFTLPNCKAMACLKSPQRTTSIR